MISGSEKCELHITSRLLDCNFLTRLLLKTFTNQDILQHFIVVFIRAIHMYMFSCSLTTVY